MSAEFCRFSTPPPPLVSKHKYLPNPPPPGHKQFPKFHNFLKKKSNVFFRVLKDTQSGKIWITKMEKHLLKLWRGKTQENLKQPEIALRKFAYVSKPMTPAPPSSASISIWRTPPPPSSADIVYGRPLKNICKWMKNQSKRHQRIK